MRPLEATFKTTAGALADSLFVKVPARDGGEHGFGPVMWAPHGDTLPQAGDRALVAESDDGTWWVLAWVPAAGFEP